MTRMFLFKSLDVLASWPADLHLVFSKGCRSWVGLAGQTLSNQTFAQTYPGKPTLLPKYKISIEWSRTIRYPPKNVLTFPRTRFYGYASNSVRRGHPKGQI